ncbi:thiamine pyrophosphate-binding protein [Schumannella soli]|uniref:thiamine pyrophosphate-binding protein n=1 Tax=Schumannella soli TaxID=2590779 RepID=UPI0034E2C535
MSSSSLSPSSRSASPRRDAVTISGLVAAELARHASDVFGVMGNGNAHFLDAVERGGLLRFTAVRHEAGGVAAADAFHRASGRLTIATTTYGAGFSNAVTPLAEARRARVPLVLVTGDQPTSGARPWDIDQVAVATAVDVPTIVVGADDAARRTAEAIALAVHGRTPVVLAIPYDLAGRPVSSSPDESSSAVDDAATAGLEFGLDAPAQPLDVDAIRQLADDLLAARRPLLLAGLGAVDAEAGPAIAALAASVGALTATTAPARGLLEGSVGDLGVAGGFASERSAAAIAAADLVVVVGAGLNQFTMRFGTAFGDAAAVVQLDLEPVATHPRVDRLIVGDARALAEALVRAVAERRAVGAALSADWPTGTAEGAWADRPDGAPLAADGRLDPRSLFRRLDTLLPDDRLIAQDGGHFIGWAPSYLRVPSARRLTLVGTAYQSIGLGFPSAIGAAAAAPDAFTVLVTGDGGGLMALADLQSAVASIRRGAIVVVHDEVYGAEVHQYGAASLGLAEEPMRIGEVDFAGLGRAVGATASTIRTLDDLAEFERWLARGVDGVHLLDCRVSPTVVHPYMHEQLALTR